jgi:hypothetical protein
VKLFLRDGDQAPSCVETLQRLLGIAEFRTTAEHDGPPVEWAPSVFAPAQGGSIPADGTLVPSKQGDVTWCEYGGTVLVDGLYVRYDKQDLRGAVVNLTGLRAPKLTVDRKVIIGDAWNHLEELLTEAAVDVFDSEAFDFTWLCEIADDAVRVADIVTSVGVRQKRRLTTEGRPVDLAVSGCLPVDLGIVGGLASRSRGRRYGWLVSRHLDAHIALWRFLATMPPEVLGDLAGAGDPLPASPSDELLLLREDYRGEPLAADDLVEPGFVLQQAVTLGRAPRSVALRLRALGFEVGEVDRFPAQDAFDSVDVTLTRLPSDGDDEWLPIDEVVPFGHVIAAHLSTGRPVREIVARLQRYSFEVEVPAGGAGPCTREDLVLLSRDVDGDHPWLGRAAQVGHGHVLLAAHKLGRAPEAVAARLTELGHRVRPGNLRPDWLDRIGPEIEELMLADLVLEDGVVAVPQVVEAAARWGVSPREAARRIGDLGLPVPDRLPDDVDEDDLALLRQLPSVADRPSVEVGSLLEIAHLGKRDPAAVADRLAELGYSVPARAALRAGLDDFDRELISHATSRAWRDDRAGSVIDAATRANRAPREVAERCSRLGYEVPVFEHFDQPLTPLWRALVETGGLVKLPPGAEVPFAHALKAVRSGLWTPAEAVEAMEAVGFRVRGVQEDGVFDRTDFDLLERLSTTKPVDMRKLISEALWFELPLHEVAARLERMGFEVPDLDVELPALLERVPFKRD